VAAFASVYAIGLPKFLTWAAIAREQTELNAQVAAHPAIASALFALVYVASVTLSLPQAALLTLIGGLLFGTLYGGLLAVIGATTGATLLFLIARSAFGEAMARRGGPVLQKLRDALRRDGFSYLLAIRLVPLFPFWLINIAAALCGMRLRAFALATLIGIVPATFITASIGAGLSQVLSRGDKPDLSVLFSWPVLGPLLALASLSLMPVLWRRWSSRRPQPGATHEAQKRDG
jgi:uncharacterized membrane protein YdjX (TVP38/TMEM64 family)